MINCVFPGDAEVLASLSLLHNILINDDLPTLLLPINANSGLSAEGHLPKSGLLIKYVALFMGIPLNYYTKVLNMQSIQSPKAQTCYICSLMTKFEHDTVVPFSESAQSKKEQVAKMFNNIAYKYDFLNRFLSAGTDVIWRKKALRHLKEVNPSIILDVATGTADVAILSNKILNPKKTILTNLHSDIDYSSFKKKLLKISKNIIPGYDGLKVAI